MKVTNISLRKANENFLPTVAFCSLTFDEVFAVNNVRIVKAKEDGKLFLSFPQEKGKDGKYYDIAFPVNTQMREEITKEVLDEYQNL